MSKSEGKCVDARNIGVFEGDKQSMLLKRTQFRKEKVTRILKTIFGPRLPSEREDDKYESIYAQVFGTEEPSAEGARSPLSAEVVIVGFPTGLALAWDFLYSEPMEAFFRAIVNYIQTFKYDVLLCGHSMGCALALHTALRAYKKAPKWFSEKVTLVGSGCAPTLRPEDAETFVNLRNVRLFYSGKFYPLLDQIKCDNRVCLQAKKSSKASIYLPSFILTQEVTQEEKEVKCDKIYRIDGHTTFSMFSYTTLRKVQIQPYDFTCAPDKNTVQYVELALTMSQEFHYWKFYETLLNSYIKRLDVSNNRFSYCTARSSVLTRSRTRSRIAL
jgi:hypothetical protein